MQKYIKNTIQIIYCQFKNYLKCKLNMNEDRFRHEKWMNILLDRKKINSTFAVFKYEDVKVIDTTFKL